METLIGCYSGWPSLLYKRTLKKHPVDCKSRIQIKDTCCITCPVQQVSLLRGDQHFTGIASFLAKWRNTQLSWQFCKPASSLYPYFLWFPSHKGLWPLRPTLLSSFSRGWNYNDLATPMSGIPAVATLKQRYREAKTVLQLAIILWHKLNSLQKCH